MTKLYLFPDKPDTLAQFQDLLSAKLKKLRFERSIKMPNRICDGYMADETPSGGGYLA
ncbi:MAG: hypothetical protein HC769_32500 [Cyanobacteria bacterium CRU_2_1]|nr:hypothetical protein [Cyanobacteria bacterium CRU_2_1]